MRSRTTRISQTIGHMAGLSARPAGRRIASGMGEPTPRLPRSYNLCPGPAFALTAEWLSNTTDDKIR